MPKKSVRSPKTVKKSPKTVKKTSPTPKKVKTVKKSPKKVKTSPKPKKVKKTSPKKVSSTESSGCTLQNTSKYQNRPSPAYPANKCCGRIMVGNDGNLYESKKSSNGVCRWMKMK